MKQRNSQYEYYFRITLDTEFKEKSDRKPYRDIVIKENQTLSTFACAIVRAFEFYFDHCYGFYDNFEDPYKSKEIYELFTDIPEEPTPGALGVTYIKIATAFPYVGKKLRFLFDYGDNWWFTVELISINKINSSIKYPKLRKSMGKAPQQYPDIEKDYYEKEQKEDFIIKFQKDNLKNKHIVN